jgi:hypothetical protein
VNAAVATIVTRLNADGRVSIRDAGNETVVIVGRPYLVVDE